MSTNYENRVASIADERAQQPYFSGFTEYPTVGIFDPPLRYYRANEQWSAYIEGAVLLLTELSAWADAQEDDHPAILNMLEFLRGFVSNINDCADVADCIENNIIVQNSINNIINNYNNGNNNSDNTINSNDNGNVVSDLSCDFDTLYGAAVALEDWIAAIAKDFIEATVDNVLDSVAKARAIDFIPVIGDLPVLDDINDLISWLRTNGIDAFDVGYSQTIRQENICRIFESMCSTCELQPSAIVDVYTDRAGIALIEAGAWKILLGAVIGTTTEEAVAAGTQALVAAALASGGRVLGMAGLPGLQKIAASGDPDSDWSLFCDPCAQTESCQFPILVNFDNATLPDCVTLENATTVQTGVGNPGSAARRIQSGSQTYIGAQVRVTLPSAGETDVSVAWSAYVDDNTNNIDARTYATAYDAQDNVLDEVNFNVPEDVPNATWSNVSGNLSGGTTAIAYIVIRAGNVVAANQSVEGRIDNILIDN